MPRRIQYHTRGILLGIFVLVPTLFLFSPTRSRAISNSIVISEFRTRGPSGESDDFIELFNRANENVSIGGWVVRAQQTRSTNSVSVVIPNNVILYPGSHYLIAGPAYSGAVRPDQWFIGMWDNIGIGLLTPGGALFDAVGTDFNIYQEGMPLVTLVTNDDRGYERKPSGTTGNVLDTDHNTGDFRLISPSNPQNLSISLISGSGTANPPFVSPGNSALLTVEVNPGQFPTSTGLSVVGDLSLIGGVGSQVFYDDATNGDAKAADNVFSFHATVLDSAALGPKLLTVHITDLQGRDTSVFIGLNVEISPPVQCSPQRLSVKTGTDADAGLVDVDSLTPTTVATMRSWLKPDSIPSNKRIQPYETTVWVLNATLILYKLDDDSNDYLVLRDDSGNTIIAKIPCPCCVASSSPFTIGITKSWSRFNTRLNPTSTFQTATLPVRIAGVALFDSLHEQEGVAPNGIELHPVLDIEFDVDPHLPNIIGASVSGKKLFVFGLNFDDGAKIFLNGQKQKTANDGANPNTVLIGKKAGKIIPRGQPVKLQVRNADDSTSSEFTFTRP